jgi:hypothetical protein
MVALAWTMLVVALPCRDTFRYHYQRDHVVETASKAKPSGIVELLGSIKILSVKASVEVNTSEGLATRAVRRLRHSYLFYFQGMQVGDGCWNPRHVSGLPGVPSAHDSRSALVLG